MREIEVKAKIEDFQSIIKKLKEMGCEFSEPMNQKDKIFLNKDMKFTDIVYATEIIQGTNVLRVRESNGKIKLTLKIPQKNEMDCIEREVEVNDAKQILDILEYLGYREVIKVNKTRKKCKLGDYEICLDEVENLGKFIELEKMSDGNAEEVQEELLQFLLKLGIKKESRVLQGYDTLIYKNK